MTAEAEVQPRETQGQSIVARLCIYAGALAIAQMAAAIWLFYPGLVSYDSILQFHEAVNGRFTTTHPPLMAAIWRLLFRLADGALPMLVMDQLFYWASFAALAIYCVRRGRRRLSVLAVFGGLWPLLLSFSGVVWKDVILAAAWGLSCALMLIAAQERSHPLRFWTCWCGAVLLLIFGAAMRHNAPTAAIVLAIALTLIVPATRAVRAALFVCIAAAVCFAVPLSSRLLNAEDSHPATNLMSWDLTGISYFSGRDYRADLPHGVPCYSPRLFDSCPIKSFESTTDAIQRWRSAIREEPVAYLQHRALIFSMLLRFGCRKCRPYIAEFGTRDLPPGLEYRPNPVRSAFEYFLIALGMTPLGRPYVWLTASIGFAALFWKRRPNPEWPLLSLISISGAVYALTYFVAAVTDEFRYVYWLIYSVVLVGSAYLFAAKVSVRDLIRWVIVPVICMVLLDIGLQIEFPTDAIAPSMATNY